MFKFLKLHYSSSGDARRHVPFASIIHKHILPIFFITILFLTLFFRPYAAEALAQLTPEIHPVYDTTIESLYDFVKVQLDDTQKQVFDIFLGSYMVGYAGMSDYKLGYVYNSDTPVKEWLINIGADLYNTILSLGGIAPSGSSSLSGVPNIGYQQLSPLLQYAMGCAIKSKEYNSVDACYNDILNSDAYPIPLKPDIMYSINAAMGYYNSLYDWQFTIKPFTSNVTYRNRDISAVQQEQYNSYFSQMGISVRANLSSESTVRVRFGSNLTFGTYINLFINSSNNTVSVVDNNGFSMPNTWGSILYVNNSNGNVNYQSNYNQIGGYMITTKTYNPANYNDYVDIARDVYNNVIPLASSSNNYLYLEDFIQHVYVGSSWSNKTEITNETNLNFDIPNKPTFLLGVENGLLDLKGLLEDILGELELRPPVINNYYYPDGSNVPEADIEPAMQNNTLPESGVDIDQKLFASLFVSEGKKSYISYLWYMTKPLILYTKDLFSCLVFDPVADFAASGPGYFVYGVVGLGLISGLLVKCLL